MKSVATLYMMLFVTSLFSQHSLIFNQEFLPNKTDSNNVYVCLGPQFMFPTGKQNAFQKSREPGVRDNRLYKLEMEMLAFPLQKYDTRFSPHFFVRIDAFISHYMSSALGAGISDRRLSSSFGFFTGSYFRRVPDNGNFITRRSRQFDNYSINGFYLHSTCEEGSIITVFSKEKKKDLFYTRLSLNVSGIFHLENIPKTLEVFSTYETMSGGLRFGFAFKALKNARLDFAYAIMNEKREIDEHARVNHELVKGLMVSAQYCFN